MDTALIGIGPLLVILAGVLLRRKGRRPVAALILGAVPLALLSVAVSIVTATAAFISGFRQLASEGKGGAPLVAELCLGITRQLFMGTAAALSLFLLICGLAMLHHREELLRGGLEASAPGTVWRWVSIMGLSALPVVGVGTAAALAERLARLTMLAVDPSREGEAQAALGSMDVSEFSSFLASLATGALGGALATAMLLVVSGPGVALRVRSIERHRGVRLYAWMYLTMVGLLMMWHLNEVLSLEAWFKGVREAV